MELTIKQQLMKKLLHSIDNKSKGKPKHCLFNAKHHLRMAEKIKEIDPEMAHFRCITAEEEMASAIFLLLREQNYENANKIQLNNHSYKQGLEYMLGAIQNFFNETSLESDFPLKRKFTLHFNDETQLIELILSTKNNVKYKPQPPLHWSIDIDSKKYDFQDELHQLANIFSKKCIDKAVKDKANLRNEILYAKTDGIYQILDGLDAEIKNYWELFFKFTVIYGFIYPYKNQKSLFIQQVLDSFIKLMKKDKDN
jgi:hypothetical protein